MGHLSVLATFAVAATSLVACVSASMHAKPSGRDLRAAAARGDACEVKQLLAAGTPIDEVDERGRSALLEAVEGGHTEAATVLMDRGASVNVQAANLDTPWLQAGALGRIDILRRMVDAKPDLTIRNRYGGNAMIPACERGHVDTVRFLLTTGIDVDHVNDLGWTCLLEAVILGDGGAAHQQIVTLLLDAGASPDLADKDGVTALAHARQKGQREVAAILEAHGAHG